MRDERLPVGDTGVAVRYGNSYIRADAVRAIRTMNTMWTNAGADLHVQHLNCGCRWWVETAAGAIPCRGLVFVQGEIEQDGDVA